MPGSSRRSVSLFMYACFSITALACLALGCGAGGDGHVSAPPSARTLSIVDSIGVETGDSDYVFGSIDRVCFGEGGSILVLDRVSCCIRVFDAAGSLLRTVGGQGEGPGEYMNPTDMAVLGDGRVIVCDIFTGGVHLLDTDLVDQGVRMPFYSDPPFQPVGTAESSFVAGQLLVEPTADGIDATFLVGRFDLSEEASAVYFERTWAADPTRFTEIVDNVMHSAAWTADASGNVYCAPISFDSYEITGTAPDGTVILSVSLPVERVARTPEEIADEKAFIDRRIASMGSSLAVDYQPSPWRYQISQLGIDGAGNLWVLRGTTQIPTFDVWDAGGNRVFTVTVPGAGEDGIYWRFAIGENRIAAWSDDPVDYPKVYLLDLH